MNATELRAAAERLVQCSESLGGTGSPYHDPSVPRKQCDEALCGHWILEQVPPDDDVPVDDAWLNDMFRHWSAPYGAEGWELLSNCIIRNTDRGYFPVFSYTGQGTTGAQLRTRGDVMRLCRILDIDKVATL